MHYLIAVLIALGFVVTLGVVALLELSLWNRPHPSGSGRRYPTRSGDAAELVAVKGSPVVETPPEMPPR